MPKIILAARGRITTYFQQQLPGKSWKHIGIDQGHGNQSDEDLEIRAPASGVVTSVGREGSYGLRIVIRHDDGCRSLLAHHEKQFVTVGQRVTQRQLIARMGNSGTVFIHSHQELWDADGEMLDPLEYLGSELASLDLITLPDFGDNMNRFITRDTTSPWFVTNGLTKRLVADSKESQALVDCGLAVFEEKTNGVNVVGGLVDTIPNA